MVANFVMKVSHACNYGHTTFGPHTLNSERITAVQSLKTAIIHQFVT